MWYAYPARMNPSRPRNAGHQRAVFPVRILPVNGDSESQWKTPEKPAPAASPGHSKSSRILILDTNVLIHAPDCLSKFHEHEVIIVPEVLAELDKHKGAAGELGASARRVHRELITLFPGTGPRPVFSRKCNEQGGTIRFFVPSERAAKGTLAARLFPEDTMDNRILRRAAELDRDARLTGRAVALVTKDLNLRLKAMAAGINAEDYLNDSAVAPVSEPESEREITVPTAAYTILKQGGEVEFPDLAGESSNSLLVFRPEMDDPRPAARVIARHVSGGLCRRLKAPETVRIPKGRDLTVDGPAQHHYLDLLLDTEVPLVTCIGQSGTGKTLLAIAAALSMARGGAGVYERILISRPIIPMGKDVGYLPGGVKDKMSSWLDGFCDNLDMLLGAFAPEQAAPQTHEGRLPELSVCKGKKKHAHQSAPLPKVQTNGASFVRPSHRLIASGLVDIQVLAHVRGRSLHNTFFILDEAQATTPHEMITLVTRMGTGSKLAVVGDLGQIDTPYLDANSNGLAFVRDRLRNQTICGHCQLTHGKRSILADLAARLLTRG
jgi:PhoH-like ATPase